MMSLPAGTRVWLAVRRTDMRKGFSTRTTQLYDRRRDEVSPGEVERIVI